MKNQWNSAMANYTLIGENEKEETRIEFEKVPLVKKEAYRILKEDRDFWEKDGVKQPGIEKNNLLSKISNKVPINSNVFGIALEELEIEQKVISFQDNNFTRYILLDCK